ncbi:MAG: phosphatase domain-containing protein [Rubricoccaceae bacterium]|nr:phosphatase domain-containing protein [Rubricoccaceae bacterium]
MLAPLTHALARIESVLDRAKLGVKWRFDLWESLQVLPYHGYGRPDRFRLKGRVLDDKRTDSEAGLSWWDNVRLTLRRFESDEIPGAHLRLAYGETALETETDEDGYFDVAFRPEPAPDAHEPWHDVRITLLAPQDGPPATAVARVVVPPPDAEFGVISDVDDTVIRTGATNKLRFARVVLLNNATTRRVFPGVGAFYQALQEGPDGEGFNPTFYVSSSPWNLYRQFMGTFAHRDVPEGPLFLKDFGIDPGKFIKSGHHAHKLDHIGRLLTFYRDLPFVLVGDSGQEDPEIYQQVVARHPGRIRAVFVRDVTDPARDRAVRLIARDLAMRGVPMHLVSDTGEAARAAAALGLITPEAVARVDAATAEEAEP